MEYWMKPMLCGTGTQDMRFPASEWACEGKLDGHRSTFYRDADDGIVHQYNGRNSSDYTGHLPYLDESLEAILPPDTCIDGELLSPFGREHVQSVMFTQQTHVPSGLSPALYLIVFDVLRLGGHDVRSLTWTDRRELVEAIPEISAARHSMILPNDIGLQVALDAGLEGVVFKRCNSAYVNKRSNDWLKIKPQQTCEATIIGFKPGKGSLSGRVGAFEIRLEDSGVVTTIKCGTDARHDDATDHPENWLGRTIQIKHHGIQKSGVPLHPQFDGLRTDLEPRDALVELSAQFTPPTRRPPVASTDRRMRNYRQMKDEKLLQVSYELRSQGEAYERCVERGSGDPAGDLRECERLIADRGLRELA